MEILIEEIKDLVAARLGCDRSKVNDETNLVNELGADSIDMVDLSMSIEAKFNCVIPIEDAQKLLSPKEIKKYLSEK